MNEPLTLNKAAILECVGGDEELLVAMADLYLQESESYCQNLAAALEAGDAPTLRREAHTLKSLMATFADEAGRELAIEIELQAKTGDLAGLGERTGELMARVRLLGELLKRELLG